MKREYSHTDIHKRLNVFGIIGTILTVISIAIPFIIVPLIFATTLSPVMVMSISLLLIAITFVVYYFSKIIFVNYCTHLSMTENEIDSKEFKVASTLSTVVGVDRVLKSSMWHLIDGHPGSLEISDESMIHASLVKYLGDYYILSVPAFLYIHIFTKELRKNSGGLLSERYNIYIR